MRITEKDKKNTFFSAPLHAFRGFAILCILAVHSWAVPIFINTSGKKEFSIKWVNTLNEVLFHDSTLFFTLISGVMFSIILKNRSWSRFYKSKLVNVISPYVVATFAYSAFVWSFDSITFTQLGLVEYFQLSIENIVLGKGLFHLWYVPILAVLFLLTPILVFIKNHRKLNWLFWLIIISPLLGSRTWPDFSWMTVVYFMGAYSLGIYVGANYEKTKTFINRYLGSLMIVAFSTTVALVVLFHSEYTTLGWIFVTESIFYVQKICIAALILALLERSISTVPHWLNVLANYAFAIYFIHGVFLYVSIVVLRSVGGINFNAKQIILAGLVNLALIILFSTAVAIGLKHITGKASKVIIGA